MRIADLEIRPLFELYSVLANLVPRARSVPPVAGLPVKIASCIGVVVE
jgi:hypothetical protein